MYYQFLALHLAIINDFTKHMSCSCKAIIFSRSFFSLSSYSIFLFAWILVLFSSECDESLYFWFSVAFCLFPDGFSDEGLFPDELSDLADLFRFSALFRNGTSERYTPSVFLLPSNSSILTFILILKSSNVALRLCYGLQLLILLLQDCFLERFCNLLKTVFCDNIC